MAVIQELSLTGSNEETIPRIYVFKNIVLSPTTARARAKGRVHARIGRASDAPPHGHGGTEQ